jgi:hypothetical protein
MCCCRRVSWRQTRIYAHSLVEELVRKHQRCDCETVFAPSTPADGRISVLEGVDIVEREGDDRLADLGRREQVGDKRDKLGAGRKLQERGFGVGRGRSLGAGAAAKPEVADHVAHVLGDIAEGLGAGGATRGPGRARAGGGWGAMSMGASNGRRRLTSELEGGVCRARRPLDGDEVVHRHVFQGEEALGGAGRHYLTFAEKMSATPPFCISGWFGSGNNYGEKKDQVHRPNNSKTHKRRVQRSSNSL